MTPTQWLAIWFLVGVAAAPFVGMWLGKRRDQAELRRLLERERQLASLGRKLRFADQAVAGETEWQKRARRAEALGNDWDGAA